MQFLKNNRILLSWTYTHSFTISMLWMKTNSLNYSLVCPYTCRFFYSPLQGHVNLRFSGQSKDQPSTQVHPPFVIKYMIQCILYAIYLCCSFNYPVLPAFEVRSISSYLMPGEPCTCAPQAWNPLSHPYLPPFSPVVPIVLFSLITQSSEDGERGGIQKAFL